MWTTPVITLPPASKIVGFWHIGVLGDWARIAGEQYATLKASGLYDASEKIVVGLIGGEGREGELSVPLAGDPKFELFVTADREDYEFPTLARAWQAARDGREPFLCYYLHTKGASHADTPRQEAVNAWRVYMEYFNVERWRDCVAILKEYETCGVELQSEESHYSGNFWWARSDYLKRLPDGDRYWEQNRANRWAAESYLCLARPRAYCFMDRVEDLYEHAISPGDYRR